MLVQDIQNILCAVKQHIDTIEKHIIEPVTTNEVALFQSIANKLEENPSENTIFTFSPIHNDATKYGYEIRLYNDPEVAIFYWDNTIYLKNKHNSVKLPIERFKVDCPTLEQMIRSMNDIVSI